MSDREIRPGVNMKHKFPYKVLIVAPSLDIMGGQAVQADLLMKNLRADGALVGFVPHNPRPPGILYELTKIKYIRTLIVSFFYLLRLLWQIPQYDIIHVFSASYMSFLLAPSPAIIIARYLGKKIILNYRSGECRDHLTRQGKTAIPIIKLADKIVVPSGYLVSEFAAFGLKAEYVYNLVDLSQFEYRERRKFEPKIIVARNLEKLYNIPASIRAFIIVKNQFPKARLTIVGAGPEEESLKRMADNEKAEGISFTGRVERSEIGQLYAQNDVFLNSSDIDNMPVSFLEAYACGLAVVSTDAGGIPYICENGKTGLLVKRDDHDGLAKSVLRILNEDGLGYNLTSRAKRECDKFTRRSVGPGWHRIYTDLYHAEK